MLAVEKPYCFLHHKLFRKDLLIYDTRNKIVERLCKTTNNQWRNVGKNSHTCALTERSYITFQTELISL